MTVTVTNEGNGPVSVDLVGKGVCRDCNAEFSMSLSDTVGGGVQIGKVFTSYEPCPVCDGTANVAFEGESLWQVMQSVERYRVKRAPDQD